MPSVDENHIVCLTGLELQFQVVFPLILDVEILRLYCVDKLANLALAGVVQKHTFFYTILVFQKAGCNGPRRDAAADSQLNRTVALFCVPKESWQMLIDVGGGVAKAAKFLDNNIHFF
jgi:hypothetical protein